MASTSSDDLITEITITLESNYCTIAAAAVIVYDILITTDREIANIWKRKFSGVTFLFLNIRYVTLISLIANVAFGLQPGDLLPCQAAGFIYYSTTVWAGFASAVFTAFRIWAVWGRHWIGIVIMLSVTLLSVILNLYQNPFLHIFAVPGSIPLGGCGSFLALPVNTLRIVSVASRASAIAADAIVLAATWIRTWSILQVAKSTHVDRGQSRITLSGLLLRDGTVYFVALMCVNIACLVVDLTPEVVVNPVAWFIESLTAVLLCRLILNLRSFNTNNASVSNTNARSISSVRFANAVLDNIGASLSLEEDGDSSELWSSSHGEVDATWDEVVSNPLAVGLHEDSRLMRRAAINGETIEEPRDHDGKEDPQQAA